MATKLDYLTISDALRLTNPMFARASTTARTERMIQWRNDVTAIAAVLKSRNKHFNVELFFSHTGLSIKDREKTKLS